LRQFEYPPGVAHWCAGLGRLQSGSAKTGPTCREADARNRLNRSGTFQNSLSRQR
jgi:hypothetical protein